MFPMKICSSMHTANAFIAAAVAWRSEAELEKNLTALR